MTMLKVLHVSDEMSGGGAEAVFRETLKASKENGDEVDFIVSDKKRNPLSYVFSIGNYYQMKSKLWAFQPNVIHIHNFYHYLTPSILLAIKKYKKKNNCKVIYTAHDFHLICPNSGFQKFNEGKSQNYDPIKNNVSFLDKFDSRSYFHSLLKLTQHVFCYRFLKLQTVISKIIFPSHFLKNTYANYGFSNKTQVVRNPFNINGQGSQVAVNKVGGQKIKGKDIISLVYFGRLSPEKGIIEFIEKIDQIKINIEFHIYGNGVIRNEIINMKCREGLKVIVHDFVERDILAERIKFYDIFVLPSIWFENAPNSIIEAAAAGLPVMVSNAGGMIEIAEQTEHYYLLNDDIVDLSLNILLLYKLRKKNRVKSPDEFSYETYKSAIYREYRD